MMLRERLSAFTGLSFKPVNIAGEFFETEGFPGDFLCKNFHTVNGYDTINNKEIMYEEIL